jgi:hypothetical protein
MSRRQAAAFGLLAALANGRAQRGRVGHGETAAVADEDTVARP